MSLDVTLPVNGGGGRTPHSVPPVLNGFLTWLNMVDDQNLGGLARAFHLAMQLAGCNVPNFPHDALRRQWERLRASLPLRPAVTQVVAALYKAHPQDDPSVPAAGHQPAVQAQKSNQSTGSRGSGGWAHSDPAPFPVGCNLQWTAVSDPPSQPMCARVLAGFLRSHFHDNLCTVLDEFVRAEFSFADMGIREEARARVEQGGTVTRGGLRVQWQTSYCPRPPSPGGAEVLHIGPPWRCGRGAAAAPPAPAPECTSGSDEGDQRRHKRSRSETRERSRSPSRERRPHEWRAAPVQVPARHVDSYYGNEYLRNPLTSSTGAPFQYGATYGYLPVHSGAATPAPAYQSPPPSPRALGHSLLPSPGNGPTTYPSPASTLQS